MAATRVRALSCHAHYACGNSGACCEAGWPIPVEAVTLPLLRHALDTGQVTPAGDGVPLTFPDERPASIGAVLGRTSTGACVFYDRTQRDGCCRVQRRIGQAAMPIACRQFPRIARHDARGTDVTLSHWCPTALACLDIDAPVTIVDMPPAFVHAQTLDGLDARETWPPLLRHDCLWDLDAFHAFEAHAVHVLANSRAPLPARLVLLTEWAERLRRWTPADGTLHALVAATAPALDDVSVDADGWICERHAALWDALVQAIPLDLRDRVPAGMNDGWQGGVALLEDPAARGRVGRYLASRLFASWIAYQGQGLRALMTSLALAFTAVVRGLGVQQDASPAACVGGAIRAADLLLVHLASPEALAAACNAWERHDGPASPVSVMSVAGASAR